MNKRSLRRIALLAVLWSITTTARAQDMPLSEILLDGQGWEMVGEGYSYTEGPAVDATGQVYFTDVPQSKIYKIALDGAVTVFVSDSQRTSGMMFGPHGKLFACRRGTKQIGAYDAQGQFEVLANDVDGNDLVVTREGALYVSEPSTNQVWYLSPNGEQRVVEQGIERPNGLILWPDQKTLVVADTAGPHLWAFRIEANGDLAHKQPYYTMQLPRGQSASGADGLTVDSRGRLYVATSVGLQVFDTQGRFSGVIHQPHQKRISNVTFGGPQLDWLVATCGDRVYRRRTQATGLRYDTVVRTRP